MYYNWTNFHRRFCCLLLQINESRSLSYSNISFIFLEDLKNECDWVFLNLPQFSIFPNLYVKCRNIVINSYACFQHLHILANLLKNILIMIRIYLKFIFAVNCGVPVEISSLKYFQIQGSTYIASIKCKPLSHCCKQRKQHF